MSASDQRQQLGIVGLGRMGGGLAAQALEQGIEVVGYDPHATPEVLQEAALRRAVEPEELRALLAPPRVVLLYVPAGAIVDQLLDTLCETLEPGDMVGDGGNSYWRDAAPRYARLAERGLRFLDVGTSGGLAGARHGACFMLGGDKDAVRHVEPLLRALAVEGGYVHAGPSGAGHLAKLVHNGIEFGMMQAIGEGLALLESYEKPLDIPAILGAWRHGSVIRSWLIELLHEVYTVQHGLDAIPEHVEDTGEVAWLVADALDNEIPIPAIALSQMQLFATRDTKRTWAKAIAAMRHGFGGHRYGSDPRMFKERHISRIEPRAR